MNRLSLVLAHAKLVSCSLYIKFPRKSVRLAHFNALQALKHILAYSALFQHCPHKLGNDTSLDSTAPGSPNTGYFFLPNCWIDNNGSLRGRGGSSIDHVLGIWHAGLRESGRGVNGANGQELQALSLSITCDRDGQYGIRNGYFFSVRVEDDIVAHGDNKQSHWRPNLRDGCNRGCGTAWIKMLCNSPVIIEERVFFALGFELGEFCR